MNDTVLPDEIKERILALTGEPVSLSEALDQWEHSHELVRDLYAHFDQYQIHNARMVVALRLAHQLIERMRTESGLFLAEKTRIMLDEFEDQFKKLENLIPQLREK